MNKNTKPLVTIITITFNALKGGREKYLQQCLESVHNQTYGNIEHIIIDGASKDGSLELIKKYVDKGWVKLYSEPDKGIYDAMNKGIEKASGKYVNFLHTDDYFQNPRAIELSVEALEESGADYSYADTQGIDAENDKPIDIWHGDINRIPFGNHYCHQSMFTSRAVLLELGGFSTSYKISADSDMMVRLVALGKKYVYVPETIVSYRSGGLSNMHIKETRKEHSTVFYRYLGKKDGLSRDDCYLLWNLSLFHEKNIFFCLLFGRKLKNPDWRRAYYKRFFGFDNIRNQIKRSIPWAIRKPLVLVYRALKDKK